MVSPPADVPGVSGGLEGVVDHLEQGVLVCGVKKLVGQHEQRVLTADLDGEVGQLHPVGAEEGIAALLFRVNLNGVAGGAGGGEGDRLIQRGQAVPPQAVLGGGHQHRAQRHQNGQHQGHIDGHEFPAQAPNHAPSPASRW